MVIVKCSECKKLLIQKNGYELNSNELPKKCHDCGCERKDVEIN